MTVYATSTVSPIVGRTRIAARLPVPGAIVTVTRVVGAVRPRAAGTPEVRCAVRAIIGRTRITGYANADTWTAAGYPVPNLEGYGFSRNSGVQRTKMRSGVTRQRRRWQNGRGAADIQIDLPLALLNKFEADVDAYGYDWFTMPLVTGANSGPQAEPHTVRITGDMRLGSVYGSTIRVNLPVEYVLQGRTGVSTTTLGTDAAAKTAAAVFGGGAYAQTVFPLNIRAVASYPGSAITNEYYMEMASSKSLAGSLTSGATSQTTSENAKTLAGLLSSGGTLVQGTYRNIENGTGTYHLDPLEASAATGAAVFIGGSLLNYVNVDNIIVSVPDGRNYIGTSDTKTAVAIFAGGTYIQDPVTGALVVNIDDEGAGTYYTGPSEAKSWAGNFNGGVYAEDPVLGALVVNVEDEGAGTYYTGPSEAKSWAGNFNGGTYAEDPIPGALVINIVDEGVGTYYTGPSEAKSWAGNFNGGSILNTDNTISSISDGGSYMGTSDTRAWAGNFNGGVLHGPLNWVMAEGQVWASSAVSRFTGVRISAAPQKSIITAIRVRGGTPTTTISSAFILIDGAYTALISTPIVVGTAWVTIPITALTAEQGVVIELAMTASSYTWVNDYYLSSSILQGFEAPTQGDTWVYGESAFGIDLLFGQV